MRWILLLFLLFTLYEDLLLVLLVGQWMGKMVWKEVTSYKLHCFLRICQNTDLGMNDIGWWKQKQSHISMKV